MKAEVKMHNGVNTIFIDGIPHTSPAVFIRTRSADENGNINIDFNKEYMQNLSDSGCKIFFIECNTLWLQPNALDVFDREARMLLDAIPDAYIIARFGMHPSNEWIENNPEECVTYSDGASPPARIFSECYDTMAPHWYSLCSQKWREAAGEQLSTLWKKVMQLPYFDRIICCFPTAGNTSEWVCKLPLVDDGNKRCLGYSEAFRREFSDYLKRKYGTDEELRKAWKDTEATIDNPKIPTYDEHYFSGMVDKHSTTPQRYILATEDVPPAFNNGTHVGSFIDFDNYMHVYDFYRCWHEGTVRSQIYFAKIIKELTPDRLVGYCSGAQCSTHIPRYGQAGATRMLMESGVVDFIENPCVYENRLPGGATSQRVVEDSFSLNNMVYMCQDDTRTVAENRYFKEKYYCFDMTDTLNLLKREFGKCICNDMKQWWFDQLVGGKRFKYPEIYDLFKKQSEITADFYAHNRKKKNEIAYIFDEESMTAASFCTSRDLFEFTRMYEMPYVGASGDQYYHDDMANPDMPSYKMYVFMNAFVLTKEEREVIKAKLKKDNAVAVWLYGAGFIDPEAETKMSAEHIESLTGIKTAMLNDRYDAMFRWDSEEHPVSKDFGRRELYGRFDRRRHISVSSAFRAEAYYDTYLYPMFYSVDENATDIAHFAASGHPAVSVKECDGYTSILYGSKSIDRSVLRGIAKFAGVHVYCDSEDVLYVGRRYITFHAATSGKKTLRFPKKCDVYEVYEDKYYGKDVTEIEFDAYFGETKMFKITE